MPKIVSPIVQEFKSRPFAYLVQVVTVLFLVLNVWLATKLAPLAQDIDRLKLEVSAINVKLEREESISDRVTRIETLLGEISTRVERIDNRLAKHMGI